MTSIYTIGHSNHKWETFLPLLTMHDVELLVDVRSRPVSRFAPFTNKVRFPGLLAAEGVGYLFIGYLFKGEALGGKPEDPSLYNGEGRPDYAKIAKDVGFIAGVAVLVAAGGDQNTAIMCSEGDPAGCHRWLLLAPALESHGVQILHILETGEISSPLPIGV